MALKVAVIVLLANLVATSYGWGLEGHRVTATIAQHFLSQAAKDAVYSILDPRYRGQLGPIASWADEIKRNPAYAWSRPYHYVDSHDNPPTTCLFKASDCEDGVCVTSAIANYTKILQDCRVTMASKNEALKFLTHYIGDIAQPLHVSGRARGGNEAHCTFDGHSTQFHAVWDYMLLEKHVKTDFASSEDKFTSYLIESLESGPLSHNRTEWESCIPDAASPDGMTCILEWATDTNHISCPVWGAYSTSGDIGRGAPYDLMAQILELQLAKGGVRLAAFLNEALGKTCFSLWDYVPGGRVGVWGV
ncbi:hypothetical protein SmJEL517_g01944 [Synchytrium microbalum]|uniref:Aspergillus nuclease S(1) n=1 Tax=Synchytrium microbalum TaxID=1806994 RepID=A0A507C822_9FUNG|nr:uncharacterized protein SmJEL517_g01944 [Synchytrium microbalum]TPX35661.1 hypothetical protein SmJEL517_g01944 [Synchytrium microbalum]